METCKKKKEKRTLLLRLKMKSDKCFILGEKKKFILKNKIKPLRCEKVWQLWVGGVESASLSPLSGRGFLLENTSKNEACGPQRRRRRSWRDEVGVSWRQGASCWFADWLVGSFGSVGSFEREGELGSGLALAQDDFLLLLLLLLTVLLQLHALLVDLSLLFHNSQLILGQFGLSFGDLAVILLQDFFQLLPLGFFFFLDGRDGAMLAHEQALVTATVNIHTHKPLTVSHTRILVYKHCQTSLSRSTEAGIPRTHSQLC